MQNSKIYDAVYIRNDQPTICGLCGARTEIILDLSHTIGEVQVHKCLRDGEHVFVEVRDDE